MNFQREVEMVYKRTRLPLSVSNSPPSLGSNTAAMASAKLFVLAALLVLCAFVAETDAQYYYSPYSYYGGYGYGSYGYGGYSPYGYSSYGYPSYYGGYGYYGKREAGFAPKQN